VTTAVLKELKRQDCDVDDSCLRRFAKLSNALYGLFVSIKVNVKGTAVATGRVMRDDGKLVVPVKSVTVERRAGQTLEATVENVVSALLGELRLGELPASKEAIATLEQPPAPIEPVKPIEPAKPIAATTDGGVVAAPPVVQPEHQPSALKTVGFVTAGVGLVAAVAGGVLYGVGSGAVRKLDDRGQVVPASGESPQDAVRSYRQAMTLQPPGIGLLVGGAAVGVAGLVMALVAPAGGSTTVSVLPAPGGAFVGVSGEWP